MANVVVPTFARLLAQSVWIFGLLLPLTVHFPFADGQLQAKAPCRPIFVRWPRVRLNSNHVTARSASLALNACRSACAEEHDTGNALQCSAFNHRAGISSYGGDECQLFRREHVQHTDGYVEADDRYTFYWKYCVDTEKSCTGEYAFTFLSDRYMLSSEVSRTKFTQSLEDCLAECLNGGGGTMLCRSVSFNRTDGGCHLSEQNQLSKPSAIRVNNNPNFRIDYYENNCYNNSFTFTSTCEPGGIRVRVDSRIPYTGALYGLYDFFSCRIEPKESKQFEYLFPYPQNSKNCSDSMRISGQDVLLEVVLSTDGVEPLYFITADDLTYQAKCAQPHRDTHSPPSSSSSPFTKWHNNFVGDELGDVPSPPASSSKQGASVHSILEALGAAAEPSIRRRFELGDDDKTARSSSPSRIPGGNGGGQLMELKQKAGDEHEVNHPTSTKPLNSIEKELFTKDMFTLLPLYTLSKTPPSPNSTITSSTTPAVTTSSSSSTTISPQSTTVIVLHQDSSHLDLANKGRKIGMEPIFDNAEGSTTATERHENEIEAEDNRSTAVTFLPTQTSSSTSTSTTTTPTTTATTTSSSTTTTTSSTATVGKSSAGDSLFSSSERVKATTKRAAEARMDQWAGAAQSPASSGREFSFSTHLAFPPDQIWMSTGNRAAAGQGQDAADTSTSSSSSTTTTTPTTRTTTTTPSSTSTTTSTTTTTTTTPTTTTTSVTTPSPPPPLVAAHQTDATTSLPTSLTTPQTSTESSTTSQNNEFGGHPPGSSSGTRRQQQQQDKVIFDIFHNGQPTEAVVVGSRITLAFTPYFAIPPAYMSISGCQVEPIGSLYEWEKEPLAIIKDGCQADHVGLVCPPQKTDYGIRVTVESFRYQTTTQVQYTCLVRICPFAPCPQTTCPPVEGCLGDDIVSRTLGLNSRAKRSAAVDGTAAELTLEQIRAALIANPLLQRQLGGLLPSQSSVAASPPSSPPGSNSNVNPSNNNVQLPPQRKMPDAPVVGAAPTLRMNTALQQQLIVLGGDTLIRRRLVVVNSEEELRYYVKTGEVPRPAGA